jgi:hypothetical protein
MGFYYAKYMKQSDNNHFFHHFFLTQPVISDKSIETV